MKDRILQVIEEEWKTKAEKAPKVEDPKLPKKNDSGAEPEAKTEKKEKPKVNAIVTKLVKILKDTYNGKEIAVCTTDQIKYALVNNKLISQAQYDNDEVLLQAIIAATRLELSKDQDEYAPSVEPVVKKGKLSEKKDFDGDFETPEDQIRSFAAKYIKQNPKADFDDIWDYVQDKCGFDIVDCDAEEIIEDETQKALDKHREANKKPAPEFRSAKELKKAIDEAVEAASKPKSLKDEWINPTTIKKVLDAAGIKYMKIERFHKNEFAIISPLAVASGKKWEEYERSCYEALEEAGWDDNGEVAIYIHSR